MTIRTLALIDSPTFFPFAVQVMSGVSYSAPVQSTGQQWANNPNAMAFRLDVSSFSGGGQTLDVGVETSPDGTNWIAAGQVVTGINANGTTAAVLNVPVMPHVRLTVTESGDGPTATLNAWLLADAPFSVADDYDEAAGTPGNFLMCRHTETLDSALAVPSSAAGSSLKAGQSGVQAGYLVSTIAGRTAGTLAGQLQTSFDGGTTWKDVPGDSFSAQSANGVVIVKLTGIYGPDVRVNYTSASSFDGNVTSVLHLNQNP